MCQIVQAFLQQLTLTRSGVMPVEMHATGKVIRYYYGMDGSHENNSTDVRDMSRHVATGAEEINVMSRHDVTKSATSVATQRDMSRYTTTVEEAVARFAGSDVPRSKRTIQRYCEEGHLECVRIDTEKNFKFLIDPTSLDRRITELQQARQTVDVNEKENIFVATEAEEVSVVSRHDVTDVATKRDTPQQGRGGHSENIIEQAHDPIIFDRERSLYEKLIFEKDARITSLETDKTKLYEQLNARTEEVKALIASDRDTKTLARNEQGLLARIAGLLSGRKEATDGTREAYQPVITDTSDQSLNHDIRP